MPTEENGIFDREMAEEKAIRSAGNKIGFSCLFTFSLPLSSGNCSLSCSISCSRSWNSI